MRRVMMLTICTLAIVGGTTLAQDEAIPLLDMLALVPDNTDTRNAIYYSDNNAITEAYPAAHVPEDIAEFEASRNVEDVSDPAFGIAIWRSVFSYYAPTHPSRTTLLSYGDTMRSIVGFGYFDIQRELTYGNPPAQSSILSLRSDLQPVRDAYNRQGFIQSDNSDAELWCGAGGCMGELEANRNEPIVLNPFNGDLERQHPMVIGDDFLMSSPILKFVMDHIDATNGTIPSLADHPDYAAVVNLASDYGPILQAYILDDSGLSDIQNMMPIESLMTAFDETRETRQAFARVQLELFADPAISLPTYNLLMFADTANETQHLTLVLLSYDDRDDAGIAADVIRERVLSSQSLSMQLASIEVLSNQGIDDVRVEVTETENGKFVVVLILGTPKGTPEQVFITGLPTRSEPSEVAPPSITYRLLRQSVFTRNLDWLSTVPVEEQRAFLEEMAGD